MRNPFLRPESKLPHDAYYFIASIRQMVDGLPDSGLRKLLDEPLADLTLKLNEISSRPITEEDKRVVCEHYATLFYHVNTIAQEETSIGFFDQMYQLELQLVDKYSIQHSTLNHVVMEKYQVNPPVETVSTAPHPNDTPKNKLWVEPPSDPYYHIGVLWQIAENFRESVPGMQYLISEALGHMTNQYNLLKTKSATQQDMQELRRQWDLLSEYKSYVPEAYRDAYSEALIDYQKTLIDRYQIDKVVAAPLLAEATILPAQREIEIIPPPKKAGKDCDPYVEIEKLRDIADKFRGEHTTLHKRIYAAQSELVRTLNTDYDGLSMFGGRGKKEMIAHYGTLYGYKEKIPPEYSEEYNAALSTLRASLEARYGELKPTREIVAEKAREWTESVRDAVKTFTGRE